MTRSVILRFLAIVAAPLIAVACTGGQSESADLTSKTGAALTVTADEFKDGRIIPSKNTADGGNLSPSISWSGIPTDTKSIAMVVDDPDANGFVHWIIYNIGPDINKLPPGLPQTDWLNTMGTTAQGMNGRNGTGYFGPQPPPGKPHHYHFHVYALDSMLLLKAGAAKEDVIKAMSGHVLAQGEIVGTYQST